jgi:hypothetical protein
MQTLDRDRRGHWGPAQVVWLAVGPSRLACTNRNIILGRRDFGSDVALARIEQE